MKIIFQILVGQCWHYQKNVKMYRRMFFWVGEKVIVFYPDVKRILPLVNEVKKAGDQFHHGQAAEAEETVRNVLAKSWRAAATGSEVRSAVTLATRA